MVGEFRRQFRWRKCKLSYGYADDFVLHQWQERTNVELLFLLYRLFFVSSILVIGYITLRMSLFENIPLWKRLIYASNWILFVCFLSAFLGAIVVCCNFAFQHEQNTKIYLEDRPYLMKLYWLVNTIAIDCSIVMFLAFWVIAHSRKTNISILTKIYHTVLPLYMIMDFWISSLPVRIMHYYITLIYALTYLGFTVVYEAAGGINIEGNPYIYSMLHWKAHPVKAVLHSFLTLCCLLVIRFFVYGMHRLKNILSRWIFDDEIGNLETGRSFASADDSLSNLAVLR